LDRRKNQPRDRWNEQLERFKDEKKVRKMKVKVLEKSVGVKFGANMESVKGKVGEKAGRKNSNSKKKHRGGEGGKSHEK